MCKRRESTHKNAYETILEQLAARIVQVAQQYSLQPVGPGQRPSLHAATNRFATATLPQGAPVGAANRASFAFVAGLRTHMTGLRQNPDYYYGVGSEQDWMPYAPGEREPIALIAQSAAIEKQLIVRWLDVGPRLFNLLEETEREHSIAVVIVDPWTVLNPTYRALLDRFDRLQFRNCVILIAWNDADPQTQARRTDLKDELSAALSRSAGRKEVYFKPEITTRTLLRTEMVNALSNLEVLLAPFRKPTRTIGDSDHNEAPPISASGGR